MTLGTLSLGDACVVGALDSAGNTIASCGASTVVPCLPGSGPLAPGQTYCTPDQISQPCPAGTQFDLNTYACLPVSPSLISGIPNTYLYVAGGILAFFLLKGNR